MTECVVPTGTVPVPARLEGGTTWDAAKGRATRFQWNTVGSRFPAQAAKALASNQLIPVTGWSACPGGKSPNSQPAGPGCPTVSVNRVMVSAKDRVRSFSTNGSVQNDSLE